MEMKLERRPGKSSWGALAQSQGKTLKMEGGHQRASREDIRKGRQNTFRYDSGRGNTEDGKTQHTNVHLKQENTDEALDNAVLGEVDYGFQLLKRLLQ